MSPLKRKNKSTDTETSPLHNLEQVANPVTQSHLTGKTEPRIRLRRAILPGKQSRESGYAEPFRKALFSRIREGVFFGGAGEEDWSLHPPHTKIFAYCFINQKVSDRIADDFLPFEIFCICFTKASLFTGSISLQQFAIYVL